MPKVATQAGLTMLDLITEADASISDCGLYRYALTRKWGSGPICTFIMLNPSTADAREDDPTIRRCVGFARREGCEGLLVGNLFAFRATKPERLADVADPIGPGNNDEIRDALRMAQKHSWPLVAAWGAHPLAKDRGAEVAALASMKCLGKTANGAPRHPLYVRAAAPLVWLNR